MSSGPVTKRRVDARLAERGGAIELLRVPAFLYGLVVDLRARLYDRGWLPSTKLDAPVVSVGNLTAGGTGKTPFVRFLVEELTRRGWRPGILSRGYRAHAASEASERSREPGTTDRRADGAAHENDEALMLERMLPGVARVQNPDRVAGGRELLRRGVEVIVLDDGFQHRRLRRDLDLVLVDATRPWGLAPPAEAPRAPRALLPRGLLRERPEELRRAHALVITRSDQISPEALVALEEELESLVPGLPILLAEHRARRLVGPDGVDLPSALRGREVDLVSGLGNPEGFEASVRALGARIGVHRAFPDHHAYRPEDLDGLGEEGRWLVTTAKDAVKLETLGRPFRVLEVELALGRGAQVLEALLDALPPGRARRERANLHEGLHG